MEIREAAASFFYKQNMQWGKEQISERD